MTHAPRRLSVEDRHPHARRVRVFVSGVQQEFVIAYDCDAGWVERYERSADNRFITNGRGAPSVETVRGNVTAVLR